MITTILFPAFVNEYSGSEEQAISVFPNNFRSSLEMTSKIIGLDLTKFDFQKNNFLDNELKSQYISYIFSCSLAGILKDQNVNVSYVSGYSMGIYASLYYCGVFTFIEGLQLLTKAWNEISKVTQESEYGMGMIVGLTEEEIIRLMKPETDVVICNRNNTHTFIISGNLKIVNELLSAAKEEGALRTNLLPVSKPYHSKFVKAAVIEFAGLVNKITFRSPNCKYVSSMNSKIIDTVDALKKEVIENLYCRMNWYNTMNFLVGEKTSVFFECGAGNGLTRNSRFIEGDFSAYAVSKLDQYMSTVL